MKGRDGRAQGEHRRRDAGDTFAAEHLLGEQSADSDTGRQARATEHLRRDDHGEGASLDRANPVVGDGETRCVLGVPVSHWWSHETRSSHGCSTYPPVRAWVAWLRSPLVDENLYHHWSVSMTSSADRRPLVSALSM